MWCKFFVRKTLRGRGTWSSVVKRTSKWNASRSMGGCQPSEVEASWCSPRWQCHCFWIKASELVSSSASCFFKEVEVRDFKRSTGSRDLNHLKMFGFLKSSKSCEVSNEGCSRGIRLSMSSRVNGIVKSLPEMGSIFLLYFSVLFELVSKGKRLQDLEKTREMCSVNTSLLLFLGRARISHIWGYQRGRQEKERLDNATWGCRHDKNHIWCACECKYSEVCLY